MSSGGFPDEQTFISCVSGLQVQDLQSVNRYRMSGISRERERENYPALQNLDDLVTDLEGGVKTEALNLTL